MQSYRSGSKTLHNLTLESLQEKTKTFCGFSMGSNQYWAGRVYDMCVYHMTGTESGFMGKPGIEPGTPGLQDIGLPPIPWRL